MEEIAETPEEKAEKLKKGINNSVNNEVNKIKKMQTKIEQDVDLANNPEKHIARYVPDNYDYSVDLSVKELAAMPLVAKLYSSRRNDYNRL